jgi:alpha-ribazole phosphatase/probable phosphoglycerate mutase
VRRCTTLLIVRHAHTECAKDGHPVLCGRYDSPLSPLGWTEVHALRSRLEHDRPAAAVYSSPLRRALDTASAAPPPLRMRMRRLNSLAEIDCGTLDGHPLAQVQTEYSDLWQRNREQNDPAFRWPGGESYRQFRKRVLRITRCLGQHHLGERVLLFTHAGVINQLLGAVAGQSAAQWENYRPANASITEVRFDGVHFELVRFDDRAHLPVASIHRPS